MTSQAQTAFVENCGDIDRLLEIHNDITPEGRGRKWKVESLHKSSFVLLTAFWEAFCEDLAAEALNHLVDHSKTASGLPKELQKLVAQELRNDQHELAVWKLADGGWRAVLSSRLTRLQAERNRRLNTPKTSQINDLFRSAVGVENVSKAWSWPRMTATTAERKLDSFVTLRGEIAHRGSPADSVTKRHVNDYYNHVKHLTACTEERVAEVISASTGIAPW
ncbi:MAE_28990/MAE_18760 family HEPN-like nuclease [Nocardia wallacei]|uniref:MAE_28990/MAE_18760 family HEPN-like nuclease n=1 Tax=Nocardia wallacei TaxID=480035 RepID=UPI002453A538|nr:MAE_28990/MAE_18760 family HEPN-like nuclease [Nocardia wallacei]